MVITFDSEGSGRSAVAGNYARRLGLHAGSLLSIERDPFDIDTGRLALLAIDQPVGEDALARQRLALSELQTDR